MRRWTETEFDILFRNHPPTGPHEPDLAARRVIARAVQRTPDAVATQWDDARSAVLGSQMPASILLTDYLARRGWL